jgi:hypothetical protein
VVSFTGQVSDPLGEQPLGDIGVDGHRRLLADVLLVVLKDSSVRNPAGIGQPPHLLAAALP